MELRSFRESKLVVPVAVVAAALGFTACGENTDLPEQGKFTSNGYQQEVHANTYFIECEGDTLVKKLDTSISTDYFSYHYPIHPACDDGQLTQEDSHLFSRNPFDNEYTYKQPQPEPKK